MYISRIVIRNFRNFELLDTKLGDRVTCVIGDNNTGKSNLFQAIRLACDINLPNYYRELSEHDFHSSLNISIPQHVLVSVEFSDFASEEYQDALAANWLVDDDKTARLTYRFRPNGEVRTAIESGTRAAQQLNISDYEWEWTGGGGDVDPADASWSDELGSSFSYSILQSFQVIVLNALRDVVSDIKHPRSSPLIKLLRVLEPTDIEKEQIIDILRDANTSILDSSNLLQYLAEAIEKAYNDAAGEAHELQIAVGLAAPTFGAVERALALLLSNEFVRAFDPSRNGLGLNNILYLVLVLEYFSHREKRKRSSGQLLLVEEPEAHLHPQLQRVLYDALSSRKIQTLITTHSAHLASHAKLSSFMVLSNIGEPAISSFSITQNTGLSPVEVADLERFLDATRSTLLFARKVILVEGPAELYLVPLLAHQALSINLDRLGISVISINGTHFEAYSKLLGSEGLRKVCAIVTDGDPDEKGVLRATKHLENQFVRVFQSYSTFEIELTLPGNLLALSQTMNDFAKPRVAAKLLQLSKIDNPNLTEVKKSVLNAAEDVGKARFAQVLSRHSKLLSDIPTYLKNAINWITD